ncbi:MAG: M23 family metallopeptidase [Candidatus Sericytochromatia bacterium]|nr:M23 family metallopeptidase [Candidatus Sericytochromatia bacterium]
MTIKLRYILIPSFIFSILVSYYYISQNKDYEELEFVKINNPHKKVIKKEEVHQDDNIFNKISNGVYKNQKKYLLPYHPVKLKKIANKLFYLVDGKLYSLNLRDEKSSFLDFEQNNEFVDFEYDGVSELFLLDKSNKIYTYDINKNIFEIYFMPYSFPQEPDPQIIKILFIKKELYALDSSRNEIWKVSKNLLSPYFKKEPLVWRLKQKDRDITNSNSFYFEKGLFYILKRNNTIDIYDNDYLQKKINLNFNNRFGYLGIYSRVEDNIIYLIGGYNGTIISIEKSTGKRLESFYIKENSENLPVYDFFIEDKNFYILAGNYLIIKDSIKQYQVESSINQNILKDSFINKGIYNYQIPIKISNVKLPTNAGMYPGARRIYRYGTHEGIDFFTEAENHIYISKQTEAIACEDGYIVRADSNYKELLPNERKIILDRCYKNKTTSNEDADKLKGRQVVIKHKNGVYSSYCHLDKLYKSIKVGDYIKKSQTIGFIGNSGTSDGVKNNNNNIHLHFEIHIDDNSKYFSYYLGKSISIEETMQLYNNLFLKD